MIAFGVFGKQHKMGVFLHLFCFVGQAARRDIHLAPDDGLDPCIHSLAVKIHHAVKHAVIGHRNAAHVERGRARHDIADARRTIEQAVFGMQMKMRKIHVSLRLLI